MGLNLCGWKCIVGEEVSPPQQSEFETQNDDDVVAPEPTPNRYQPKDSLGPEDIVNFFVQLVNCIGKYAPYNKVGLKRFAVCIINRALCGSK